MGSPNPVEETKLWAALPDEQKLWPVMSHSRVESYLKCKFQWYVRYIHKYSADAGPALIKGNQLHEGLASYYRWRMAGGRDPEQWKRDNLHVLAQQWMDDDHPESLKHAATAIFLLDRYIGEVEFYDQGHTVVDVERHFLIPLSTPQGRNFLLQGYIDLLTISPLGTYYAWDHKSGANFWQEIEASMHPQLPTYAGALRKEGIHIGGFCINQLKTYDYKDKSKVTNEQLFHRDWFDKSQQEIDAVYENILVVVDDLLATEEYIKEHGGQPVKSLSRDCKYCNLAGNVCSNNLRGIPVEVSLSDIQQRTGAVPSFSVEGFDTGGYDL